jgi:hypothetical protein
MKVQQLLEAEKKDVTPLTKINRIARAMKVTSKKYMLNVEPDMGFTNKKNERSLKVDIRVNEGGPMDFSKLIDPNDPNAAAIQARMEKKFGKLPSPEDFLLDQAVSFLEQVRAIMPEMSGVTVQPSRAAKFIPCSFEEFRETLKHYAHVHPHQVSVTFQMIFPLTGKASFTLSTDTQRYKRVLQRISEKLDLRYGPVLDWKAWRFFDSQVGRDLIIYPYQQLSEHHYDAKTQKSSRTQGTWDFSSNAEQLKQLKQLLKAAEPKLQELAQTTPVHVSWKIGNIPMADKFEKTSIGHWLNSDIANKDEYLKKTKVLIISFGDFKS